MTNLTNQPVIAVDSLGIAIHTTAYAAIVRPHPTGLGDQHRHLMLAACEHHRGRLERERKFTEGRIESALRAKVPANINLLVTLDDRLLDTDDDLTRLDEMIEVLS